uniref:Putative germacrene A oxidase n=1 Tax=Cichorium endivia TaxID=114280 RepID=A0A3S5HGR1_CICEN|nr:putative germacrene A oxidase [Cichorium endivia]
MEPVFLAFQIISAFLIFIFMLLKLTRLSKTKSCTLCLPPGPWKLPLIGNIHNLGSSLPHQRLRKLAEKYGPLMHLQLGQLSVIVVSSPETAKEVMKTHDVNFADRPYLFASSVICNGATNLTFAPYGDYWRRVRKICSMELLSPMRVQSFTSTREQEVSNFIKSISQHVGSPVDLSERIFSLTYGITARVAFGKKCKDQESFIALVKEASAAAAGFNVSDLYPSSTILPLLTGFKAKLEKIRERFEDIIDNIIEEHQAKKVDNNVDADVDEDLVDVLLRFQENGDAEFPLSIANIKAVILDIFSGGSETSSTTVEWAMSEMLKHPTILEKAQTEIRQVVERRGAIDGTCIQELVFLKLIIKETLRLHPPAPLLLPRESRERCEINGYEIPPKTKVIVNAWAIGRDPMWWKDPERFHPERFISRSIDYKGANFEYIPFGGGRRVCPGMSFGLANVELPLIKLLYHFDWKLPDGMTSEDLDMNETSGVTVRRKANLNLIPIAYHPLPK